MAEVIRIDRYDVAGRGTAIELRMRQGRRTLSVALISLAVVAVSWWYCPYGPQRVAS